MGGRYAGSQENSSKCLGQWITWNSWDKPCLVRIPSPFSFSMINSSDFGDVSVSRIPYTTMKMSLTVHCRMDGVLLFLSSTLSLGMVLYILMLYCCPISITYVKKVRYVVGNSKLFLRLCATVQFKQRTMRTITTLMIFSLRVVRENFSFRRRDGFRYT